MSGRTPLTTDGPVVTVAVVTHNSSEDIPDFLRALRTSTGAPVELRVVVVDNGSTDGTTDLVRSHEPEAQVIDLGSNEGYAAGVNAAMSTWPGDGPFFVLNPHTRPHPGCLEELL